MSKYNVETADPMMVQNHHIHHHQHHSATAQAKRKEFMMQHKSENDTKHTLTSVSSNSISTTNTNTATTGTNTAATNPISATNPRKHSHIDTALRNWNELTCSADDALHLFRLCNQNKLYGLVITLFRGWNNKDFGKADISLNYIVQLLYVYGVALLNTGDIVSALCQFQICLNSVEGMVQHPNTVNLSNKLNQKKHALRTGMDVNDTKQPFIPVIYNGPDPVIRLPRALLNQLYPDILRACTELVTQEKVTEYEQTAVASFESLFACPPSMLHIQMGEYFPNGSSRTAFREMNPSIWIDAQQNVVWMNLRLVSWSLSTQFQYVPDPIHKSASRNVIVRLDSSAFRQLIDKKEHDWVVADWKALPTSASDAKVMEMSQETIATLFEEIQTNPKIPPFPHPDVMGYEDVRFIGPSTSNMWITFHSFEHHSQGKLRMMLGRLDMTTGQLLQPAVLIHGFGETLPKQKNWMGFWHMKNLFFIYSWCPIAILHCVPDTGQVTMISLDIPKCVSAWRGSSPPLEIPHALWTAIKKPIDGILDTSKLVYKTHYTAFVCLVHNATWRESTKLSTGLNIDSSKITTGLNIDSSKTIGLNVDSSKTNTGLNVDSSNTTSVSSNNTTGLNIDSSNNTTGLNNTTSTSPETTSLSNPTSTPFASTRSKYARMPNYTHRFVVFVLVHTPEHTWRHPFYCKLVYATPEFKFSKDQPIEFVNSLAWDTYALSDKHNPYLIIPYGSRDDTCLVTRVPWTRLCEQFHPLDFQQI